MLAATSSGCFASHERAPRGDAGAARDTGRPTDVPVPSRRDATLGFDASESECSIDPGVIVGLDCPESVARGEPITVDVRVHMLGCCAVSAPIGTTARSIGPDSWELEAPYSVCRCCEMCMCEEIVSTRSVTIEPPTGSVVRVVARDLSCEIRVLDDDCRTLRSDDWMAPRHVAVGEPIPVRVFHDGGVSCGCTPRTELATPAGPELSFLACGCSDLDPCVDPGYEATAIAAPASSPGQVQFYHPYGGGRVVVDVHHPATCVEDPSLVVDALSQVAPDPRLIAEDPRATWIAVRGHHDRCCGEPAVRVRVDPFSDGRRLSLLLRDCQPDPCDCAVPHRVEFVERHFLGSLPSGTMTVRAGTHLLTITVP